MGFFQQRENIHRCKIKYVKYPREICFLVLAAALLEETKQTKPPQFQNQWWLETKDIYKERYSYLVISMALSRICLELSTVLLFEIFLSQYLNHYS